MKPGAMADADTLDAAERALRVLHGLGLRDIPVLPADVIALAQRASRRLAGYARCHRCKADDVPCRRVVVAGRNRFHCLTCLGETIPRAM